MPVFLDYSSLSVFKDIIMLNILITDKIISIIGRVRSALEDIDAGNMLLGWEMDNAGYH